MALTPLTQWWMTSLSGASDLNGMGYDSSVTGAGTNFALLGPATLALTDIIADGSAVITSVTGGFSSAMVGNVIRIVGKGYFCILTRNSTNSATVDRPVAAGTGLTGKVGGSAASPLPFCSSSSSSGAPPLTNPAIGGNYINIRGAGSDTPSAADYTFTQSYTPYVGSHALISGDGTAGNPNIWAGGQIKWVGYNGRPRIHSTHGRFFTIFDMLRFENLYLKTTGTSGGSTHMTYCDPAASRVSTIENVVFNQGGYAQTACNAANVIGCVGLNSGEGGLTYNFADVVEPGTTLRGFYEGLPGEPAMSAGRIVGNYINGWQGCGFAHINAQDLYGNVCANVSLYGVMNGTGSCAMLNNTFYRCGGSALYLFNGPLLHEWIIRNNIFAESGAYGYRDIVGIQGSNQVAYGKAPDYNAYYGNALGEISGFPVGNSSAMGHGDHDVILTADPFVDAANGNFHLNATVGGGAAIRGMGWPSTYWGSNT